MNGLYEGRQGLLFLKKKQKTFVSDGVSTVRAVPEKPKQLKQRKEEKFFGPFFQKRTA